MVLGRAMLSEFRRNDRGTIAIIFAFAIFVIVGAAGMAVDYGYALSKGTKLQAAADAGALAAGRLIDKPLAERKAAALATFKANYAEHSDVTFSVHQTSGNSMISVTALQPVPTFLMRILGKDSVNVRAAVEVPIAKAGFAEVALVMDYSDSMLDSDKYVRMHEAAAKMIDTISNNGANANVKFALVPFAAVVRADIPSTYIRSDVTFDGCTMDRQHPFNTQEGVTTSSDAAKWGDHSEGGHNCADVASKSLKVWPLSDNLSDVKAKLASFQPFLWTHIAAGAEFGWQVLSPDGVFGGARSYSDEQNVKAVIILTDGMQTAPGWGPGGTRTVADAEANLLAICSGMKAKKIEVFTVGYDLTDSHTLSLLQSCANSGQHYASTDIDNGLTTILAAISSKIQDKMLRLAK